MACPYLTCECVWPLTVIVCVSVTHRMKGLNARMLYNISKNGM